MPNPQARLASGHTVIAHESEHAHLPVPDPLAKAREGKRCLLVLTVQWVHRGALFAMATHRILAAST